MTFLSLACAAAVLYFISYLIYNLFFHPLARFPGSPLWIATRFTYIFSLWSGNLAWDVQKLHEKYGDVIRIAPNEISFARSDAWHDIYSNTNRSPAFPKSKLWHGAPPGRPLTILNALDPKEHMRFRKAMDPGFSESAIRSQEAILQKYATAFISRLEELPGVKGDGTVVNIVRWFGFFAFDVIGDLGFGESFDCLQSSEFHPWVSMIFNSLRAATLVVSLRYYPQLLWLLRLAIPKRVLKMQVEHQQMAVDKVNRRLNLETQRPDFISHIKLDEKGKQGLTLAELYATASIIIVAGSETTVTVVSGTTNHLVKNAEKLAILTSEVRARFSNENEITLAALRELPYLNAVIQEGLRMCNPAPVGLPRIVPPGGGSISGYFLPENTFVNVHPLGLGLSPNSFFDPKGFHPERWLSEYTKDLKSPFFTDDRSAVQPFSVGPRACIGKSLSYAELRLILARLVWNFDMSEADTDAGKLKWEDQRVFTVVERKPFDVILKRRKV